MSTDLQWLLTRNYNSHMVKRVAGGPVFSREPGNLRNIHSYKYSGVTNARTIAVHDTPSGIEIVTRKQKASQYQVRLGSYSSGIRVRSSNRRALSIAAGLAKRGYRRDLKAATVARVSALLLARKKKETIKVEPVREKKIRGSKKGKAVKGLD